MVLRPEPGNAATVARLEAIGVDVLRCPLFAVGPLAWTPPDPARFDALLLTSANALRHAGAGLAALAALPVLAVGEATAAAARAAGLRVTLVGDRDAAALATQARARGHARLLHLAGRERTALPDVEAVAVYASRTMNLPGGAAIAWASRVALLHSARAARRFAALVERDGVDRALIAVAALSDAVAGAAGSGWGAVTVADAPTDAALAARAAVLIDPAGGAGDKPPR